MKTFIFGWSKSFWKNRERLGHPHIVQISALGADPQHSSRFLSTKGKGDALLLREKNTVVIRPSIICTPNTMIVQKLKMLKALLNYSRGWLPAPSALLKTRIQPVLMEDVAAAVFAASKSSGVLELCGPDVYTLRELMRYVYLHLKPIAVPLWLTRALLRSGWFDRLISYEEFLLLQQDNVSNKGHLQQLLGRPPKPTPAFFIHELI